MKAAVLHGPGDLRIEEVKRPQVAAGEVLVRVTACGVCNSDVSRVRDAEVPRLPLIPGHEFAGVVEEVGEGTQVQVGRRVAVFPLLWCGTCESCRRQVYECCADYAYHGSRTDGGFAQFVVTRAENLVELSDAVSDEEGAMSEPAAVGLHALNRAGLADGETVAVIGAGTIGLIAAQLARARGAQRVVLLDILPEKLALAREFGFEDALSSDATDLADRIAEICEGGPDIVVEAAGSPTTYNLAIDLARPEGRVVLMGNITGDLVVPQRRVSSILRKQLRITGTWNSSLVRPENEWAAVHGMVARGEIELSRLISHRIGLEELPAAIRMMEERREPFGKVMVHIER